MPHCTIIYGGPHASFMAHNTLTHIRSIDIVVHGEGEYISLDLARWKASGGSTQSLGSIVGITYRENDCIKTTGWRPFMRNLDSLPLPARNLLPMKKYSMNLEYLNVPATSIMTARGCPISCSYCSASKMFQNHYAYRSPPLVVDEIEGLIQDYGFKGFKIFDSTFTLNRHHVIEFCNELDKRGLVVPWECEVRVGSVTRELLGRMKKSGCYFIDVGFESGDQTILDSMHKQISLKDAETILMWAKEMGIWVKGFFSMGHIGETLHTGRKTLAFIRKNTKRIKLIGYNPAIRIYPGTNVETYAVKNKLLPHGFNWALPYNNEHNKGLFLPIDSIPIFLQPTMGIQELKRIRIEYGLIRLVSLKHLWYKVHVLLHYGQMKKYLRMVVGSVFGRIKFRL